MSKFIFQFIQNNKKKLFIIGASIAVIGVSYSVYRQYIESTKKLETNFNENNIINLGKFYNKIVFKNLKESIESDFNTFENININKITKIETLTRNVLISLNSLTILFIISKIQINVINTHLFLNVNIKFNLKYIGK
jgi:hypothetical protein